MTEDYYSKAERLLDLISDLVDSNTNQDKTEPLIQFHQNGAVYFSPELIDALNKPQNKDLHDWAYENIKDLF